MTPFIKASLVSSLIAALSVPVLANAQGPAGPGAQARKPAVSAERRPFSRPTERVEAMLAYQRTALKITDAQQSQWNAYADFARKQAKDMEQRFAAMRAERAKQPRGQRPAPANAIQRLERQQSFHAEAVRRLNERLEVQKPLYAALSPEQQRIADRVLSPRGARRDGAHGGRMMRGHGHTARG